MVFFSDFEKASDSIDHEFLMKCLKHFNFSEDFINWLRIFYSNATGCVTNNNFQSEFFPVKRGCPLSPYLLIFCMELLTYQIRINKTRGPWATTPT